MVFPAKDLPPHPAVLLAGPSLLSQQCLVPHAGLGHHGAMSPRPSWLHPLVATLSPGPAFPGKEANSFCFPVTRLGGSLLRTPLEGCSSTGPAFAEGGLTSRGNLQTMRGRGARGQLCQLTTPQCAQQLYLSTRPAAIFIWNATGAKSLWGNFRAAEEHDPDVIFTVNLLLCTLLPFSRGFCYLLCSSLYPTSSTMVTLGSSSLCPSHRAPSGLPFPQPLGTGMFSFLSWCLSVKTTGHPPCLTGSQ